MMLVYSTMNMQSTRSWDDSVVLTIGALLLFFPHALESVACFSTISTLNVEVIRPGKVYLLFHISANLI